MAGHGAYSRVHLGSYCEIDVFTFDQSEAGTPIFGALPDANVGSATAPQAAPEPTLTLDAEFPDQYAYEVLVFDLECTRRLVAAVEIVSPANKDRPESRQLFVAKCFNLLRAGVCLSIIDLVTIRHLTCTPSCLPCWTVATRRSVRRHRPHMR